MVSEVPDNSDKRYLTAKELAALDEILNRVPKRYADKVLALQLESLKKQSPEGIQALQEKATALLDASRIPNQQHPKPR